MLPENAQQVMHEIQGGGARQVDSRRCHIDIDTYASGKHFSQEVK